MDFEYGISDPKLAAKLEGNQTGISRPKECKEKSQIKICIN